MISSVDDHELDEGVTYYIKPSQSSQCPGQGHVKLCSTTLTVLTSGVASY